MKSTFVKIQKHKQKIPVVNYQILLAGLIILISGCLSIFFPFSTYVISLAIFGVPHIVVELRYIDSRFHSQISDIFEFILIQVILMIAIIKCFSLSGFWTVPLVSIVELCLVLCLVLATTFWILKQNLKVALIGLTLSIGIGSGICLNPLTTLISLAILHNLTPIGFIANQFRSWERRRALLMCVYIFLILPLVIFISRWMIGSGLSLENFTSYLNAFVPEKLQTQDIALPLFSAVTFLQCMHYAVIIGLFSQWTLWQAPTLIPWHKFQYFVAILLGVATLFLIGFTQSFLVTRAFYSIIAAIHAWVEIPLLLITLIPNRSLKSS